jgi:hypothetical protein
MSFFFTLLDESLRPKGSRDPLGLEHVWSQVGRKLVGNLTTVTSNLDNFIIAIVGFQLAAEAKPEESPDWSVFERFEQITSRMRFNNDSAGVLGTLQLKRTRDLDPIKLGSKGTLILQDAKRSGIWGLYATALAVCRITDDKRRLTLQGKKLAEAFIQQIPADTQVWLRNQWRAESVSQAILKKYSTGVLRVLGDCQVRKELLSLIINGGGIDDNRKVPTWQELLAEEAKAYVFANDRLNVREFLASLHAHPDIGEYTQRMIKLENVLLLVRVVFEYVLGMRGRAWQQAVADLQGLEQWPELEQLHVPDFPEIDNRAWKERAEGLRQISGKAQQKDWEGMLESLLAYHAAVMKHRGGPAWCSREGDIIRVIAGEGSKGLPAGENWPDEKRKAWDNSYFISPFLQILYLEKGVGQ